MARILVADADPTTAQRVRECLAAGGHIAQWVRNGQAALGLATHTQADLVILAADLPDLDGLEVTQRLRSAGLLVPVILTASRADVSQRIVGLETGADDYLSGPFKPRELLARVEAVLRRARVPETRKHLQVADLTVEPQHFTASTRDGLLNLRPQEFRLLRALASQPGRVLSRERLVQLAWQQPVGPGTVDVHVSRVRGKLRGSDVRIENVWGRGYRLISSGPPGAARRDSHCRSA